MYLPSVVTTYFWKKSPCVAEEGRKRDYPQELVGLSKIILIIPWIVSQIKADGLIFCSKPDCPVYIHKTLLRIILRSYIVPPISPLPTKWAELWISKPLNINVPIFVLLTMLRARVSIMTLNGKSWNKASSHNYNIRRRIEV